MPKGILLGFAAFASFAISDAFIKSIHGALPAYQLGFFSAAFSVLLLPFVWKRGTSAIDLVRPKRPALWVLRGILSVINILTSVLAFTHLSMAEAFALIFLMPLAVTAMSVWTLNEKVTLSGWAAIVLGFLGVLVVLRPGFREIELGHIAALTCGFTGAGLSVLLRKVGQTEKPISLFGAGQLFPLVIFALLMIPGFVPPTPMQWVAIAFYATLSAGGNMLLMFASRLSPASQIAPTQYSQMLWGIGLGYVFFHDHIDLITLIGVVLIVGAGLWLFLPKRQRITSP
ncbi:DMT family transporter [Asticcacaulis machinosus]|uniref:DMT family transporter n=1 Tax=Asticcacaulis machinosus TaxID=2984211 RepID=A0ABT5HGV8_9CAUL|nr:DMT family transporter [Asticcacaulis machinosus]MDC7675494.1 DMT family transporter [Asticcacaulis machinosus]